MKTYTAYFRTDADFATREIKAATPEQALNPIEAAFAVTPSWMLAIRNFDAIEVHPCCVVGFADGVEFVETGERDDAHFWSVYGHCVTGGLECFEDFPTEAEAEAFAARLRRTYPHLAGEVRR